MRLSKYMSEGIHKQHIEQRAESKLIKDKPAGYWQAWVKNLSFGLLSNKPFSS